MWISLWFFRKKGEKYYSEGKIKEGIECFEQLSQLMVNIYGHS